MAALISGSGFVGHTNSSWPVVAERASEGASKILWMLGLACLVLSLPREGVAGSVYVCPGQCLEEKDGRSGGHEGGRNKERKG